jgi:hypothetical protein
MKDRRTALGLTMVALGCNPSGPGTDDEADSSGTDDDIDDGEVDVTGEVDTDTGPNDIPFELVLARYNATGKFIALRFSEAVGPVDGIDPGDFRISFAQYTYQCSYDYCFGQTTYWDPNFYVDHYLGYDPYSTDRLETDLMVVGNMPTDIVLRFETPLDPAMCQFFPDDEAFEVMFVHYSPGAVPVMSADGEVLAPIGQDWVEVGPQYVWGVEGEFPLLNPRIAIPCTL